MTGIDQLNRMDAEDFATLLGGVYEHSRWVAEAAAGLRPFTNREDLNGTLRRLVDEADDERKLALLKAHPDLAGKLAIEDRLTAESRSEQASLGLDRLSAADFSALTELNSRYRTTFGFPFIICVRRVRDIPELLAAFRTRIGNDADTERRTALAEVHAIASLRIADLVS